MPDKIINDGHMAGFPNQVDRSLHFQSGRQHNKYQLIKATSLDPGIFSPSGKPYSCYGDTLSIDRVEGGSAIYIKIEDSSNPWVRIFPGDIITRPNAFTKIFITMGDAGIKGGGGVGGTFGVTTIFLYSSFGKLFEREQYHKGFGLNSPAMRKCTANAVARWLFEDYFAFPVIGTANFSLLTAGLYGGQVIVKNTDPTNTLILVLQAFSGTGPGQMGFPLVPGESVTLDLSRAISDTILGNAGMPLPAVFTEVGNCEYAWMLSAPEMDAAQIGQTTLPLDMS